MLNFFKTKPLIAEDDARWILDTFYWALQYFDHDEFFNRSILIQPSDQFFPGKVDSNQAMASTVFTATLKYSGLAHWPIQLIHPADFNSPPPPFLNFDFSEGIKRDSSATPLPALRSALPLAITYNPQQTLKPEDLSASFAHYIAQYLLMQSQLTAIGGKQYFAEATEIIAVFMGFGVLMANSAYTFRGSCGRCYNANANRHAALSEDKIVFALVIYCRLKGLNRTEASKNLKRYLRAQVKQAWKQLDDYSDELQRLLAIRERLSS